MLMIFMNIINIAELDVERACIILSRFRANSIRFEHGNVVSYDNLTQLSHAY
jgi:hypothetical protein